MSALPTVVVGGVDFGEADRIVRLLSPTQGRISAVARGARKSKKRFAGRLDVGTQLRLDLRRGRGDLMVIADLELVSGPRRAREDLDRIALLMYGCELCAALAPEHDAAPRLTQLLVVWLDLLEGEGTPGGLSRVALEAKALTFAGLTPALMRCAACGEALDDPAMFDAGGGGGVHARCGGGTLVSVSLLAHLETLRRTPLAATVDTSGLEPTEQIWLLSDFARYQLGRDLRTRALLEELAGPSGGQ